jgi:NADH-quinone oxidoreductase subunit G
MEVSTQETSPDVADAQASVLEFILINHPLDCTVCDQAGHCKLQDYHYEYNARPSRFLEEKVHKVKAEPLGPTVMLDGERCIMCSRCVRFCDEVTQTSEIGLLNRGDRTVIAVSSDRPLENPLSGTVVDLCPVGALTHRSWRFNSRIWFSKQTDSICPGCSTGCNVRVAERDGEVVQVKARYNPCVNKEWLCDEGRYGFGRFLPANRLRGASLKGAPSTVDKISQTLQTNPDAETVVFVSPDLLFEEYVLIRRFLEGRFRRTQVVVGYRERTLSSVEAILVNPDRSANFRGAQMAGLVQGDPADLYDMALRKLRANLFETVIVIGERGILPEDCTVETTAALSAAKYSLFVGTDANSPLVGSCTAVIAGRSVLEKSGLLINKDGRVQYADRVVPLQEDTQPEWRILLDMAKAKGPQMSSVDGERELTLSVIASEPLLAGIRISDIKAGGVSLPSTK